MSVSGKKKAQICLVSGHPDVYPPCDDSFLLVDSLLSDHESLSSHNSTLCLEIGCGSGYVITSLALIVGPSSHYLATDINSHALESTSETIRLHELPHSIDLIQTDIVSGLEPSLAGKVDVMVVNPPYVPTPWEEVGTGGIAAAWAGGENGTFVINRVLEAAEIVLSEKGWLYLVVVEDNDPVEICMRMGKRGFLSRILLRRATEEEFLMVIKFWRDDEVKEKSEVSGLKAVQSFVKQVSSGVSSFLCG